MVAEIERNVARFLDEQKNLIGEAIVRRYLQELSSESTLQFEGELEAAGTRLMRMLLEWTLNQFESDVDSSDESNIIRWQCGEYRRENRKTPNRNVATRFGTITLWRYPYR